MDQNLNRARRTARSTLVEPFKQIKFGLYVFAISVTFVLISGYLFVRAFTEQYQHVMGIFNIVDPSLKWELVTNDVFYANAMRLGVVFVTFIAVLFTVVFRLTHRYYGPLVSIERFVDEMTQGLYNRRVTIRNKDELQRLAHKLNAMAEALEQRHGQEIAKQFKRRSSDQDEKKGDQEAS